MMIPITEKSLKQYIKEIVDEELHCKFYEDLWDLRPFELISEGLIMTYAPHKLISILNRKYDFEKYGASVKHFDRTQPSHPINKQNFVNKPVNTTKDYNRLIEIKIYFKYGLQYIDNKILEDIIHTCESC